MPKPQTISVGKRATVPNSKNALRMGIRAVVLARKRIDAKASRNSRIDNIVRLWGIKDRLICDPDKMEFPHNDINYCAVSEKVEALRTKSLAFLDKALNS